MKQINKYDIVSADNLLDLINKVNDYIKVGWTIHGNVFKVDKNGSIRICQPVVLFT
ncbi:DUF1737 domain-containing protein [Chryseobacterium arthrosphaerae]|uniref:DUF1737 domain-containing protein n=1 Tax=Chryseobacterium arthrosphaerae TaxID=651561 RepID=UPI0023E154AD|nr:DUF1737 domain-containing protein [Chryseobacterium arthrosphaerae]WES99587.1 DUF1737 domain-containing protein [Chryseobacterium arthrosphaerae]